MPYTREKELGLDYSGLCLGYRKDPTSSSILTPKQLWFKLLKTELRRVGIWSDRGPYVTTTSPSRSTHTPMGAVPWGIFGIDPRLDAFDTRVPAAFREDFHSQANSTVPVALITDPAMDSKLFCLSNEGQNFFFPMIFSGHRISNWSSGKSTRCLWSSTCHQRTTYSHRHWIFASLNIWLQPLSLGSMLS